jgi:hypothetical protein
MAQPTTSLGLAMQQASRPTFQGGVQSNASSGGTSSRMQTKSYFQPAGANQSHKKSLAAAVGDKYVRTVLEFPRILAFARIIPEAAAGMDRRATRACIEV